MGLALDTSRDFRSLPELRRLVEAVRDAPPSESEPDWMEWKSQVDLRDKRWLFEIARHSLGFANRQPEAAAAVAGGCGYLLMGVEPSALPGVAPVDVADIDSTVVRYLGSDGPRWAPTFVEVDGAQVLVVITEPPAWGDPIHSLRREYDKYLDGDVFVRRHGKTHKAKSSELRTLEDRSRRQASQLAVEVGWRVDPEPIRPLELSAATVEAWVEEQRRYLLAPLTAPSSAPFDAFRSLAGGFAGSIALPEDRSEEEYQQQVQSHLDAARAALPSHLRRVATARVLAPLQLELINQRAQLPQPAARRFRGRQLGGVPGGGRRGWA